MIASEKWKREERNTEKETEKKRNTEKGNKKRRVKLQQIAEAKKKKIKDARKKN